MNDGRIFSVGYGTHPVELILERLAAADIAYVIDVRSAPYSRFQPDFSRVPFKELLAKRRIKYVFMGDLLGGRPNDENCYTDGKVDYSKTRRTDFFRRGLDRLKAARSQGLNICMLCSESQPRQCHRAKLIGAALSEEDIKVTHILPNGAHVEQADVIAELTKGQKDMFGDHFVSRNTYR